MRTSENSTLLGTWVNKGTKKSRLLGLGGRGSRPPNPNSRLTRLSVEPGSTPELERLDLAPY